MIKLINIEKSFENQEVLRKLNIEIPENKITSIIGLSGSGKSVILKHMVGLMKPDKGNVILDGVDITKIGRRKLNNARKSYSMLFQGVALFDSLTVYENISLSLRELTCMKKDEIRERVKEKLEQVGLSGIDHKYPAQLSGGMKKRVGLARALITNPKTIFFDEPTTGLDPLMINQIHKLIKSTQEKFCLTVVVVSHEIPKVFSISDYVAVLYDGRIVEFDIPEKILKSKKSIVSELIKHGK